MGSGDLEPAGDLAEIPGDLEPTGGNPDVVLSTSSVGGERETPRVSLGEPTAAMEASAAEKGMAVGGRPCTPPKPLLTTRPRRIPSEVRWRHSARTHRPAPAAALDTPSRCELAPSRGELAPTDRVLAHIPPPPSEAYALAGGVEGGDCMRRATPPKYADDTDDAEESSGGLASALLACMPGRPDAGTPSGDGCREGEGCTSDTWPSDTWPCEEVSGLSSRRSPARLPCAPAGEPKLRVLGKPLEPALESERRLGAVPSSSGPMSAVPSVADRSTWTEAAAILAPT